MELPHKIRKHLENRRAQNRQPFGLTPDAKAVLAESPESLTEIQYLASKHGLYVMTPAEYERAKAFSALGQASPDRP